MATENAGCMFVMVVKEGWKVKEAPVRPPSSYVTVIKVKSYSSRPITLIIPVALENSS